MHIKSTRSFWVITGPSGFGIISDVQFPQQLSYFRIRHAMGHFYQKCPFAQFLLATSEIYVTRRSFNTTKWLYYWNILCVKHYLLQYVRTCLITKKSLAYSAASVFTIKVAPGHCPPEAIERRSKRQWWTAGHLTKGDIVPLCCISRNFIGLNLKLQQWIMTCISRFRLVRLNHFFRYFLPRCDMDSGGRRSLPRIFIKILRKFHFY